MIRFQTDLDFERPYEYLAPLAALTPQLRERGICFDPRRGDFIFTDGAAPPDDSRPLVVFDLADAASLWWRFEPRGDVARRWLASDRMAALLKMSRYSSLEHYNNPASDEAVHVQQVRFASGGEAPAWADQPRAHLEEAGYRKLLLRPGFWMFEPCQTQLGEPVNFDPPRSLDVFCAVTVDYGCPAVAWHRRKAIERLNELKGRRVFVGRGRVLERSIYSSLLRQARICVSPWGWGETSHRDYEALAAGCVLIKPKTDFVDSLFPLDEDLYVPCRPDFSDLAERVEEVLSQWRRFEPRRREARSRLLEACDADRLADQFAEAFTMAVKGSLRQFESGRVH